MDDTRSPERMARHESLKDASMLSPRLDLLDRGEGHSSGHEVHVTVDQT